MVPLLARRDGFSYRRCDIDSSGFAEGKWPPRKSPPGPFLSGVETDTPGAERLGQATRSLRPKTLHVRPDLASFGHAGGDGVPVLAAGDVEVEFGPPEPKETHTFGQSRPTSMASASTGDRGAGHSSLRAGYCDRGALRGRSSSISRKRVALVVIDSKQLLIADGTQTEEARASAGSNEILRLAERLVVSVRKGEVDPSPTVLTDLGEKHSRGRGRDLVLDVENEVITASYREVYEAVFEPHDLPMAFSNRTEPFAGRGWRRAPRVPRQPSTLQLVTTH